MMQLSSFCWLYTGSDNVEPQEVTEKERLWIFGSRGNEGDDETVLINDETPEEAVSIE